MNRKIRIAIDGYSGCGKSTLAKDVANAIGYKYVDSGAMYRALTVACIQQFGNSVEVLVKSLDSLNFQIQGDMLLLNGQALISELRTAEVSSKVSEVAAHPAVRKFLKSRQQAIIDQGGLVMEGRDIGSAVMPEAELKVFLTAQPQVRAKRRWMQIGGESSGKTIEEVEADLLLRDQKDTERKHDPLVKVEDAIAIDNTKLSREQQVEMMIALVNPLVDHHLLP